MLRIDRVLDAALALTTWRAVEVSTNTTARRPLVKENGPSVASCESFPRLGYRKGCWTLASRTLRLFSIREI
jgi:hypothetical protein